MSLAFAMDSPIGLAAWLTESSKLETQRRYRNRVYERSITHTDHDLCRDEYNDFMVLTEVGQRSKFIPSRSENHKVPTGVAMLPAEMVNGRPPRSIAERDHNIVLDSYLKVVTSPP